jgi:hypothetical protein
MCSRLYTRKRWDVERVVDVMEGAMVEQAKWIDAGVSAHYLCVVIAWHSMGVIVSSESR